MQGQGKNNNNIRAESDISVSFVFARTYNYHSGMSWASIHCESKNGKARFTSLGKSTAEFKYYNQLDPGTKDKKKPICESRRMALNRTQEDQTENGRNILEWL